VRRGKGSKGAQGGSAGSSWVLTMQSGHASRVCVRRAQAFKGAKLVAGPSTVPLS
jgi:hypothetical protein